MKVLLAFMPAFLMAGFIDAGMEVGIDPEFLKSVAKIESNINQKVVNYNKNGTVDYGIMQVNSCHFEELEKEYNITKAEIIQNEDINIRAGAIIISKCFKRYGVTYNGINCYNGLNYENRTYNTYANKILAAYNSLKLNAFKIYNNTHMVKSKTKILSFNDE